MTTSFFKHVYIFLNQNVMKFKELEPPLPGLLSVLFTWLLATIMVIYTVIRPNCNSCTSRIEKRTPKSHSWLQFSKPDNFYKFGSKFGFMSSTALLLYNEVKRCKVNLSPFKKLQCAMLSFH
jgi:hypothetical protein